MKELAELAYRDTTGENREFWKNEMGHALREIQQVYDDKLETVRGELETLYNVKVSSMQISSFVADYNYLTSRNNINKFELTTWRGNAYLAQSI